MQGDSELIHSILQGNKDGFNNLVQRYSNIVYGTAYNKLGDFHLAEDVTQEVFLKAYLHLGSLKEPDKVGNWLYSIACTTAIDWLRKNKDTPLDIEEFEAFASKENTEEKVLQNELCSETLKVLNSLPEQSRLITILHYMSGYKSKDIAEVLNLTVAAVESRLHRIKQRLRKEMLNMVAEDLRRKKLGEEFQGRVQELLLHVYYHLWNKGRYEETLSVLSQLVNENPNDMELQDALGFYYYKMYKLTKDSTYLEKSKEIFEIMAKSHPRGMYSLATMYARQGEYIKALEIFKSIEDNFPLEHSVSANKLAVGHMLGKAGEFEEASRVLQSTVYSFYNRFLTSIYYLAKLSGDEGRTDLQKDYFEKIITIIEAVGANNLKISLNHFAYLSYAKVLIEQKEITKALDVLTRGFENFNIGCMDKPNMIFDKAPVFFNTQEEQGSPYFKLTTSKFHTDFLRDFISNLKKDVFTEYKEDPRYKQLLREVETSLNNYTDEYNNLSKKVVKK